MRSKLVRVVLIALCCMMLFGGVGASALIPYATYTYSVEGQRQISPDAYVPLTVITSATIKKALKTVLTKWQPSFIKTAGPISPNWQTCSSTS